MIHIALNLINTDSFLTEGQPDLFIFNASPPSEEIITENTR